MMEVDIFCALPDLIASTIEWGTIKRARDAGELAVRLHDMHALTSEPHGKIDDCPYGGGPGMILRVDAVAEALEKVFGMDAGVVKDGMPVVLLSPSGRPFDQAAARRLSLEKSLAVICGRYEGVDDRVSSHLASEELSIGDFVLSGGEVAAAVIVEAIARLLPGVIGNEVSLEEESFSSGLLEYPQFTRPSHFRGLPAPEVLLSGDHARIAAWREEQALKRTREVRPDLLEK